MQNLAIITAVVFALAIAWSWRESYCGANTRGKSTVSWEPDDGMHVVVRNKVGLYRRYKTLKPHRVTVGSFEFYIPEGFEYDGASIPWYCRPLVWLFDPWALYERPAAVHDYLCRVQIFDRSITDAIFNSLMMHEGVPTALRHGMFRLVSLFGGEAWEQNHDDLKRRGSLRAEQRVASMEFTDYRGSA